jgi:multidrug efflux pump subunit AcrB
MDNFLASIIRHRVLANVTLLVLFAVGFAASMFMIREFFPEMSVDVVMVSVVFPGADPEEVEEGISRKVEEAIDSIQGIKKYTTFSAESISRTVIEAKAGTSMDSLKDRVKNAVDSIRNLPEEAENPVIAEQLFEQEVIRVAFWGDLDERTLKEWGERLREEILELPGISRVDLQGTREYEVGIEVSEERMREYGLSFAQVSDAIRRSSLNLAGGTIRTSGEEIRIRTLGRKYTGKDFASIVLLPGADGTIITLDRVAEIRDAFVEDPVRANFNGEPSSLLVVKKVSDEDAIAISKTVKAFVADRDRTMPEGANLTAWGDFSLLIQDRINLLTRNGLIGLSLVFFLLWLFLDMRLSFWVGMGIPISFAGAMGIMWLMGASINMISLFALILVLGIIVDDAIVVGEAIYVHRRNGDAPLDAAVNGVKEVGLPVLAAVTTSIVAFIPLAFIPGFMGKFMIIMPIVVISALLVSLVECLFLLPAHLNHLPDSYVKGHESRKKAGRLRRLRWAVSNSLEYFVDRVYGPFLSSVLQWRYVALAVSIFVILFTVGLFGGGFITFVVFPTVDGDEVSASIEFPAGTPFAATEELVTEMRDAFDRVAERVTTKSGDPLIKNIFTVAGTTGGRAAPGQPSSSGSHLGYVLVELLNTEDRNLHFEDLNVMWKEELGPVSGSVALTFAGVETGPPGAPIDVGLRGRNHEDLVAVTNLLKNKLREYAGIYQVDDDYRLGKNELQLSLKPEARTLGLTVQDLAGQMYSGYFGQEAVRLQRNRDDIRVRVRYTEDERSRFAGLEGVRIRTPLGDEVPLFSVANLFYTKGPSTMVRADGQREISVKAQVDTKRANAGQILGDLTENFFPEIAAQYPEVSYTFQGAQTESRDAFSGLVIGFPIALIGIFVIVTTIFRSYVQPFIILITVPFGIIGALFGHMLLGYQVTIMSVFGMVALSGVVVNDAIVLIERINVYIANGLPFFEAIRRGGERRFRAIFLTTASTCGGLTPLISERSMQAQFLIPMAISLASGVAFATLLTLVFIPCLLAILNDLRRIAFWVGKQTWPTPEEVEPARLRGGDHDEIVHVHDHHETPALESDGDSVPAK